ncbi:MAG: sporulation protein YqfD, partial [Oscillospiraceae bacterium]|nr:sporulation protein YqfD [Oscillospiraceae bacterium]
EITETESQIKIFGTEYPIGIVKAVCEEVQYKEVEISLKDAKEKAKKLLYAKIDEELKGCEIVKKSFSGEQKQDKYIISGSCIVLEDICETEKILIKNP